MGLKALCPPENLSASNVMVMNGEFGRIWKDMVKPPCLKDCSSNCPEILKRSTRNLDSSVSTVTRLWSGDRKTGSQFSAGERIFVFVTVSRLNLRPAQAHISRVPKAASPE